ncbi:histidine kinase N-terminal 7TM domain-containing protein [Patescibacteria group bacterium]
MMILIVLLSLLSAAICVCVLLIATSRGRSGTDAKLIAGLTASQLVWSVSTVLALTSSSQLAMLAAARIESAFKMATLTLILFFLAHRYTGLRGSKHEPKIALAATIPVAALILFILATNIRYGIEDMRICDAHLCPNLSLGFYASMAYAVIVSLAALVIVLKASLGKSAGGRLKREARAITTAFILVLGLGLLFEAILPTIGIAAPSVTTLLGSMLSAVFLYEALIKSQLDFNLRTAGQVINALPELVMSTDIRGHVVFANRIAAATLDTPVEQLHGKALSELVQPVTDRPLGNEPTRALLSFGGREIPVSVRKSALDSRDEGMTVGHVVVMHDMRQELKMASEIEQSRQDLDRASEQLERFNQAISGRDQKLKELQQRLEELKKS